MQFQNTRRLAKELGDIKYFTGLPCKHGHVDVRATSTGRCYECARVSAKEAYESGYRPPKNKESKSKSYRKWRDADPKGYWASATIQRIKKRSIDISVPFNLTKQWLIENTPEFCPVFGTPFLFFGNNVANEKSASLDRLNPSGGYTTDNVVVVSMKANVIKNAFSSVDIYKVAAWLAAKGY